MRVGQEIHFVKKGEPKRTGTITEFSKDGKSVYVTSDSENYFVFLHEIVGFKPKLEYELHLTKEEVTQLTKLLYRIEKKLPKFEVDSFDQIPVYDSEIGRFWSEFKTWLKKCHERGLNHLCIDDMFMAFNEAPRQGMPDEDEPYEGALWDLIHDPAMTKCNSSFYNEQIAWARQFFLRE